jgi:hypothetical protein
MSLPLNALDRLFLASTMQPDPDMLAARPGDIDLLNLAEDYAVASAALVADRRVFRRFFGCSEGGDLVFVGHRSCPPIRSR